MEANIFEVPVLTIFADPQFKESLSDTGYAKSFSVDGYKKFREYFNRLLTDSKIRKNEISKGLEFVDSYLSNQGSASENIVNKIL